jgi:hypothetical protein
VPAPQGLVIEVDEARGVCRRTQALSDNDLTMARPRRGTGAGGVRPGQEVVRMMPQPDDPRPRRSADHDRDDQERLAGAAGATADLHDGTGSAEPVWVLPSIVLGFVALTGSVMLFAAITIIGITLLLMNTPPTEHDRETSGQPWPGPFGGPGLPL